MVGGAPQGREAAVVRVAAGQGVASVLRRGVDGERRLLKLSDGGDEAPGSALPPRSVLHEASAGPTKENRAGGRRGLFGAEA